MARPLRPWSALLLTLALALPAVEDPATATLPLRAALHEDATLEAPLTQLVETWRAAERLPDLLALYRTHLSRYPQDAGATVVLIRLLHATRDPAATTAVRQALVDFPQSAYLHWLAFLVLDETHDAGALDQLALAVTLETVAWRRDQWTERLITEAVKGGRRDLAERHLAAAAAQEATAGGKLVIAKRQAQAGLHQAALATITNALAGDPAPELLVDLEVEAAASEAALKQAAAAATRLDALLQRLGPDHWRRAEITRRRLELAGSDEERSAMIAAARARLAANPGDDAAALDLARLLLALDRRRDALTVLTAATTGERGGVRVEQELLTLHERLHDPLALDTWLAQRLAAQPTRSDLGFRRVRTLIDLGRGEEATALRRSLGAALRAEERGERLLALARELRRDGRHGEAAQVLEELLAAEPQRIDLTRELCEAWLAAGNRGRAEELLARDLPPSAAPEQVLDLVQFLLGAKQYLAASRAIQARLALDPGFFELRVQAIRLAGRTGDVQGADTAALAARALTDTAARYRLWLEAGVEAAGEERDRAWLEREQQALAATSGGWDGPRVERVAAFAEICNARDRAAPAILLLDDALADGDFPANQRAALRRQLVALIEREKDQLDRLPEQLALLAQEDPALAMECRARALLLTGEAKAGQRPDGTTALGLAEIEVQQLSDPALVARIETVLTQSGNGPAALACLKRLTVLEPATIGHWERWLTELGASKDEAALREAIRRLLAGVDQVQLSQEIREQLVARLGDSCWRSAAAQAATGTPAGWQAVLALLDEAATTTVGGDAGWLLAGRALALHHLGRHEARAQVMVELGALGEGPVVFPDGLGTSRAALEALIAAVPADDPPPAARPLPPAPWRVAWSATFPAAVHGTWIADGHVLAMLADGSLMGLDRSSGSRRWHRPAPRRTSGPAHDPNTGRNLRPRASLLRPVVVGTRVVVANGHEVCAYAIRDGTLAWRCNLLAAHGVVGNQRMVLAWNDDLGRAIGIDPADGRLRWSIALPALANEQSQGASQTVSGDQAVLLGQHAVVIDLPSGGIRWSFSDAEVAEQKVTLVAATAATAATAPPLTRRQRRAMRSSNSYSYMMTSGSFAGFLSTGPDAITTSWTTTFINRARLPWASVTASGGDLFIGDEATSGMIPLTLPLACTPLPAGSVLGTYGRRVLVLTAHGVQVCALDDGTILASLPLLPVLRKKAEGVADQALGPWVSGSVSGRLAWISGPGGVMTIDLDSCAVVDQQTWDPAWSVAPDDVASWTLGGARIGGSDANRGYGPSDERLPVGAIAEGLVVLPVGTRRLVALDAGIRAEGGSDGR